MSTVLDSIVSGVLEDLEARKVSQSELNDSVLAAPPVRDAFEALSQPGTSIIAEVKRSSPSKGALAAITDPVALALDYQSAGAAVVSVLTEGRRFEGTPQDLIEVRQAISIPVLRKDFTVTEYQVYETRALGADLILLIVAALSDQQLRDFYELSRELGMHVLVEVHDEDELKKAVDLGAKIIGVNSRNLKTLEINEDAFAHLLPLIPMDRLKVAESGISERSQVERAEAAGAKAILVGETLVRSGDPKTAINRLLGR